MSYRSDYNTGLPAKFSLNEGKFSLSGGTDKVKDNIFMYLSFVGWFRTYYEDYTPDILWLLQKPVSLISQWKTIILGNLLLSFRKYITFALVNDVGIAYYPDINRKEFGIVVDYSYNLTPESSERTVEFITL